MPYSLPSFPRCSAPRAVLLPLLAALVFTAPIGYAQNIDAQAMPLPRTPVVKRYNLRDASAGQATTAKHGLAQLALGDESALSNDVVVKRAPDVRPEIQSLIQSQKLVSESVYVQDLSSNDVLYDKGSSEVRPIASISKLMAALVVIESGMPMDDIVTISDADVDRLRYSRSRLPVGAKLSRADMLHLALMASENRAAHALGRYHPGGMPAFVRAMNDKARALGMRDSHFVEPTGLSSDNVSTARDLVKLVQAASQQPLISRYSTSGQYDITLHRGRQLAYRNSNRLVRNDNWDIQVSKTGFINEAGECLVMQARIEDRDVAIVLLNASPRSRIADAIRVRSLVQKSIRLAML